LVNLVDVSNKSRGGGGSTSTGSKLSNSQASSIKSARDPKTGLEYYYDRVTRTTTWTKPSEEDDELFDEEDPELDELDVSNKSRGTSGSNKSSSSSTTANTKNSLLARASIISKPTNSTNKKKAEKISTILRTMSPPNETAINSLMKQYEGREDELLNQLKSIKVTEIKPKAGGEGTGTGTSTRSIRSKDWDEISALSDADYGQKQDRVDRANRKASANRKKKSNKKQKMKKKKQGGRRQQPPPPPVKQRSLTIHQPPFLHRGREKATTTPLVSRIHSSVASAARNNPRLKKRFAAQSRLQRDLESSSESSSSWESDDDDDDDDTGDDEDTFGDFTEEDSQFVSGSSSSRGDEESTDVSSRFDANNNNNMPGTAKVSVLRGGSTYFKYTLF